MAIQSTFGHRLAERLPVLQRNRNSKKSLLTLQLSILNPPDKFCHCSKDCLICFLPQYHNSRGHFAENSNWYICHAEIRKVQSLIHLNSFVLPKYACKCFTNCSYTYMTKEYCTEPCVRRLRPRYEHQKKSAVLTQGHNNAQVALASSKS